MAIKPRTIWASLSPAKFSRGLSPELSFSTVAGAALNFVPVSTLLVGQGLECAAQFDEIAVAILPLIEEFEIRQNVIECHGVAKSSFGLSLTDHTYGENPSAPTDNDMGWNLP